MQYLPVAQLDRATDSDSVGRRFESYRVGQKSKPRGFASGLAFFVLSDGFEGRAAQSGLPVDVRDRERPRRVGRAANRILSYLLPPDVLPPGLLFLFCPMDSKDDAVKSSSCEELSANDQG